MDAIFVMTMLQAMAWLATISGLFFVARQLRLARKSYVDLHDWNRRNAAQTLFWSFNSGFSFAGVQDALDYANVMQPLEVDYLQKKFSENKQLQLDVSKLLNFFECLCVGVQNGVYDRQIIETGFKGLLMHGWLVFKKHIEFRQNTTPYKSWETFAKFAHRWEAETKSLTLRAETGN